MRLFVGVIVIVMCSPMVRSQLDMTGITIDGSVRFQELNDTVYWKTVIQNEHLVVRESKTSYYVAVLSNVYTAVNLYSLNDSLVRVFHVSYSLGDAQYKQVETQEWQASSAVKDPETGKMVYEWKFRDPILRPDATTIVIEKELSEFYENHLWVGSTMPMGSHREVEFLVSKKLLPNIEAMRISYLVRTKEGSRSMRYFPEKVGGITGSPEKDRELQNGYLPAIEMFNLE